MARLNQRGRGRAAIEKRQLVIARLRRIAKDSNDPEQADAIEALKAYDRKAPETPRDSFNAQLREDAHRARRQLAKLTGQEADKDG